jgi:hypothetical protein
LISISFFIRQSAFSVDAARRTLSRYASGLRRTTKRPRCSQVFCALAHREALKAEIRFGSFAENRALYGSKWSRDGDRRAGIDCEEFLRGTQIKAFSAVK